MVPDAIGLGEPLRNLPGPVGKGSERRDDEVGGVAPILPQVGEEGNDLDGLSEAHFVGQDSGDSVLVERREPAEALELVNLQLAALGEVVRLNKNLLLVGTLHAALLLGRDIGSILAPLLSLLRRLGCLFGRGCHVSPELLEVRGNEVGILLCLIKEMVELLLLVLCERSERGRGC